ncbi:MAG: aminotransferase class I/II-fold pyridoxal phosphate-dependent enzyme [Clostridia bacterium]|nr:aminotransferase class I/II-fold pyridoxal phosphate-dependent enzyme [Clostridia bacterium]
MMKYSELSKEEIQEELKKLRAEYAEMASHGYKLNMARGVLSKAQLELTQDMLTALVTPDQCCTESGTDCRNYGLLDGIPEAKRLMADILGIQPHKVIVGGNSSLNLMYDAVARNLLFGTEDVKEPWAKQGKIKFICPVPGYDRHFAICEALGIEMINVDLLDDGPDMDAVEKLVSSDPQIKGMWCVPKYSNPTGTVYSDKVIRRIASLKPAAKDFRVFWDNAYVVHSLYGEPAKQLEILAEAEKQGNPNMIYEFASTSKISFPGSGVAVIASSPENIEEIKHRMGVQTIGHDKLNQMRHVRYFKNMDGIREHMKEHAAIIAPKFKLVTDTLKRELDGLDIARWTEPEGGYFVSLDIYIGSASRVYILMSELGVTLTPAGATFPYHLDPNDRNLRIAPTFPPIDELKIACDALCLCVRIAALERLRHHKK